MSPEELVVCVNFQHITDAITPDEAMRIVRSRHAAKFERSADLKNRGICPIPHVLVGWDMTMVNFDAFVATLWLKGIRI